MIDVGPAGLKKARYQKRIKHEIFCRNAIQSRHLSATIDGCR
jgi:hypothetical protein